MAYQPPKTKISFWKSRGLSPSSLVLVSKVHDKYVSDWVICQQRLVRPYDKWLVCTDSLILDPISYKELHVRIAKALLILYRQQGSWLAVLILIGTRKVTITWTGTKGEKKGIIYMRLCFFVDQQIIIGVSWQKDRSILVVLSWVCH